MQSSFLGTLKTALHISSDDRVHPKFLQTGVYVRDVRRVVGLRMPGTCAGQMRSGIRSTDKPGGNGVPPLEGRRGEGTRVIITNNSLKSQSAIQE
jgi:hypothetical protein